MSIVRKLLLLSPFCVVTLCNGMLFFVGILNLSILGLLIIVHIHSDHLSRIFPLRWHKIEVWSVRPICDTVSCTRLLVAPAAPICGVVSSRVPQGRSIPTLLKLLVLDYCSRQGISAICVAGSWTTWVTIAISILHTMAVGISIGRQVIEI